jgi:replicative DNA helicase
MDRAKEAAQQAKASAEKMAQQGQAKVAAVQQSRSEGELYKALGEAVYAEQRRGGAHEAVQAALQALDAHFSGAQPPAAAPPADQSGVATPPPAGDFRIEDM